MGSGSPSWLEATFEQFVWEATGQTASVIAALFHGTVLLKCCIDFLRGSILSPEFLAEGPVSWLESVMTQLR